MPYAVTHEAGAHGKHFVCVQDLQDGLQYHFDVSSSRGVRFACTRSDPPRPDMPKAAPCEVVEQANRHAQDLFRL